MLDPNEDEEPRGKLDGIALLYIAGGIPMMWLFLVVLFSAVKLWGIPA